jgi:hypothetical protein
MWSAAKVSDVAHRSAALRGAAMTETGASKAIVKSEFFSRTDFSETIQEDLPANSAYR